MKVDAAKLKGEPWEETCSLLDIPGGCDQPYCEDLKGSGNKKIMNYVSSGGHYLGFCAGAYYASKEIEFQKGKEQEIIGSRELGFFDGICRGTMFPGFIYNSEKGARSVSIVTSDQTINTYYNGGGYFMNANQMDHVKVICKYNVDEKEEEFAAGVQCQVGKGSTVLFGVHPEYNVKLVDLSENENKETIIKELTASLPFSQQFLSQSLANIGLKVKEIQTVPEIIPLYLSAINGRLLNQIKSNLLQQVDINGLITDSNDCFSVTEIDKVSQLQSTIEKLSIDRVSDDKSPVLLPSLNTTILN